MNQHRNIVVKTLLNADEFLGFERHCKEQDVSQSRAIRDLVKGLIHGRNRSAGASFAGRTRTGQKLAFPSRRAALPLRL